jgi:hypothetical protein
VTLTTRIAAAAGSGLLLLLVLLSAAASAVVGALASPMGNLLGPGTAASWDVAGEIPAAMYGLYHQAATGCPGMSWSVLAGIGKVESDHGRATVQVSPAGAEGPMQMLPATFTAYATPVPLGGQDPPTPLDPVDAVFAAARMLCHNGAGQAGGLNGAVFAYCDDHWYAATTARA